MAFKLYWCLLNIIFCFTIICAQFDSEEGNGSSEVADSLVFDFVRYIQPLHYDVHLIISSTEQFLNYDGIVKIKFESKTNSKLFQFISAESINITSVKLVNLRTNVEARNFELKRKKEYYSITDDAFLISNTSNLIEESEIYELEVRFSSKMDQYSDNRGFFASKYNVNNDISYFAATHFQTKYIRDVIPTFEDLSFKIPIKLRITHNPKFRALSNMPGRVVSSDNYRVTTEFDETPPMPSYLLAFGIGEFKSKPVPNDRNLTFTMYGSSKIFTETDDATAISGKILLGMEDYFTIPYSLPKMDYLIIPEFPFYGMENWGLVVFIESKIFGSWKKTETSDLVVNTVVNAHELAHQYFGNLVTPREWRHVWLSEGFATFFSYYILNRVFPNDIYNDQFLVDNLFSTYELNDFGTTLNPRSGKTSIYDVGEKINYYKASSIIRMIMHVMGEQKFRTATIMYLNQYQYNSTTPTDLISIYESVVKGDTSWPVDIKMQSFVESWTHQSGSPVLNVTRNYRNGDVKLKQIYDTRGNEYDDREGTWWLPYNYATKRNPNFDDTRPIGWMKNETMITINLNLGPNDWIIFNKQYTSLYIVDYDKRNWELLINELIHGNLELIHQYNRAQLIHDLNRLVRYEKMDRIYLIKLLFYLKREKNHLPWTAAEIVLNKLWRSLRFTQHSDILNQAIRYMTGDAYEQYRLNAKQNDSKSSLVTRNIVSSWACKTGYQTCLQDYDNLSVEYLNFVTLQQTMFIHPDIKVNLFCYGFQNETNYKRIFDFFLANSDHPDAAAFFSKFDCKPNTKLFRTYYHISQYGITVQNMEQYPGHEKVGWIIRRYLGDEITVVYQCLLENCFDFRLNSPNDYANEISDLLGGILNPRYIIAADLPRIRLLLAKVQEVYGNEPIKKLGKYTTRYRFFW